MSEIEPSIDDLDFRDTLESLVYEAFHRTDLPSRRLERIAVDVILTATGLPPVPDGHDVLVVPSELTDDVASWLSLEPSVGQLASLARAAIGRRPEGVQS